MNAGHFHQPRTTLLFDIDGTMLTLRGAGMQAFRESMSVQFGIEQPHQPFVHGSTDRGIAAELFQKHQIVDSCENWDRLRMHYVQSLASQTARFQGEIFVGVMQLLEMLARDSRFALGLLTGNVQQVAWLKLNHFGISHHFRFGAFGDHHHDRCGIACEAVQVAQNHLKEDFSSDRIWVIGDTPNDVRCAEFIGAKTLAVATGFYPVEALRATGATHVLENLADADEVIRLLSAN
jgi:phosphoglycolate phosphatase